MENGGLRYIDQGVASNVIGKHWNLFKPEPGLEIPLIDPVDIAAGGLVGLGKGVARSGARKSVGKLFNIICFAPGTKVLMSNGKNRCIEDIKQGDFVFAENPELATKPVKRKVLAVLENKTKRFYEIFIDGDGDKCSDGCFQATGEHPIWTINRGWVYAKELYNGDILKTVNDDSLRVTSIAKKDTVCKTYNLTIEDIHTFFIVVNDYSILVHNTGPKIHALAPDFAVKGVHVTSKGIELTITGGGSNIKIKPVFSKDLKNPGLNKAIKAVEKALHDPAWRKSLLQRAQAATKYLGQGDKAARAASGGTNALAKTLLKWCK